MENVREGSGEYFEDGTKYIGNWVSDKKHGQGK